MKNVLLFHESSISYDELARKKVPFSFRMGDDETSISYSRILCLFLFLDLRSLTPDTQSLQIL